MMCSIILYNHLEKEKIVSAILEKIPRNTIAQHLIPYNPELRIFSERLSSEFETLRCSTFMQKIKKILRAVLEKTVDY